MISSAHNSKIQRVRALAARKGERSEQDAFVAEGVRLLEEALQAGWPAELVLHTAELSARGRQLLEGFRGGGSEVYEVPPGLMRTLADTDTPQGILAVLGRRRFDLPEQPAYLLVLDQVRDPGNLGTILRTAVATGADGVVVLPGTTDPFAPKALRAGMGAQFRLPVVEMGSTDLARYKPHMRFLLAEASEGTPCWSADLFSPCALIIGGEAEGAGDEARRLVDEVVTIPMPGRSESLNAGVAASILMYELVRQRSTPTP